MTSSSASVPNAAATCVVHAFQENHARSKFKRLNTARIVRFASKVEPQQAMQADRSPSPHVRRGAGLHNVRRGRVSSPRTSRESPAAPVVSPANASPSVHWGRPRRSSRFSRDRVSRDGSEDSENESPATRKRRVHAETAKQKGRIIDNLTARSHTLHSLKRKVHQQRRLSIALICLSLLGIALMITELEARIELAWSLTVLDLLRAIGVAITLAATVLIVAYNRNQALIQQQCGASRGAWVHVGSVLFESVIMLAGVVPPFVEAEYELTLLNAPLDAEAFKSIHLDSIGLLMLLRLLLVAKWSLNFSRLPMPALLAWQYGVELSPTFRYKYLFSTRPWELLLVTFLLTTFGGAFVLHVLAFDAAGGKGAALHYWEHLFIANDILTGLGYQHGPPPSAAARVIALALAWFGVMGTAFLTATLCQFSDLNSAESWMIRILDRKRLSQMQRHSATLLVQRMFRLSRCSRGSSFTRRRGSGGCCSQQQQPAGATALGPPVLFECTGQSPAPVPHCDSLPSQPPSCVEGQQAASSAVAPATPVSQLAESRASSQLAESRASSQLAESRASAPSSTTTSTSAGSPSKDRVVATNHTDAVTNHTDAVANHTDAVANHTDAVTNHTDAVTSPPPSPPIASPTPPYLRSTVDSTPCTMQAGRDGHFAFASIGARGNHGETDCETDGGGGADETADIASRVAPAVLRRQATTSGLSNIVIDARRAALRVSVRKAIRSFKKYRIMQEDSNSVANTKIMHGQLSHLTSALGASLTAHAEQLQACMEAQMRQMKMIADMRHQMEMRMDTLTQMVQHQHPHQHEQQMGAPTLTDMQQQLQQQRQQQQHKTRTDM